MTMISGFKENLRFKFSKKQNEQKISDLNFIKNANIYRKQNEKETGNDFVTENNRNTSKKKSEPAITSKNLALLFIETFNVTVRKVKSKRYVAFRIRKVKFKILF